MWDRNKENKKLPVSKSKENNLGDILKTLRAKSVQKTRDQIQINKEHSVLLKKYQAVAGEPIESEILKKNPLQSWFGNKF